MEEYKQSPQRKKALYRLALAHLVRIVLIALLCVGILISVVNDLYAFVKPDRALTLSLDAPQTLGELAKTLARQGVIKNPTVFTLYVKGRGRQELRESFSGELLLNASMSYREILIAFAQAQG